MYFRPETYLIPFDKEKVKKKGKKSPLWLFLVPAKSIPITHPAVLEKLDIRM